MPATADNTEFATLSLNFWLVFSGIPVEKRSGATYKRGDENEMHWEVVKEIGDTLVSSGTFTMEGDK